MFHFISHHKVKQHNTSPKRRINTENFIHPEYMVVNEVSKGPSAHYHTLYMVSQQHEVKTRWQGFILLSALILQSLHFTLSLSCTNIKYEDMQLN